MSSKASYRTIRTYESAIDSVFAHLEEEILNSEVESPSVYFLGIEGYLGIETMLYEARKRGLNELEIHSLYLLDDAGRHSRLAQGTHFQILPNDSVLNKNTQLPGHSEAVRSAVREEVISSGEFCKLGVVHLLDGDRLDIYRTMNLNGSWAPFQDTQGLWPLEGPFPELNLPRVRWGVGPATRLTVSNPFGASELLLDVRTMVPGNTVTVLVNGEQVSQFSLASATEFTEVLIPLPDGRGVVDIELRYSKYIDPRETDPRPLAALYKSIRLAGYQGGAFCYEEV